MSSEPTTIWNGTVWSVGAGPETTTGLGYRAIIESLLDDPSYFKVTINSFDFTPPTGSVDLDIEVMEDVPDISQMNVRMCLTEDGLIFNSEEHNDVNREMPADTPITVNTLGQIQNVQANFAVDPTWTGPLKLVTFIQDDADKKVIASTSTNPNPDYSLRYYALGQRGMVAPVFASMIFDKFRVYNMGNVTDDFTAEITLEGECGDWIANLCDDAMCYGPTFTATLAPGEFFELHPDIISFSSGYAKAIVTLTQTGAPGSERALIYMGITDDIEILLVDDDGVETYEAYFIDALQANNHQFALWDRNSALLDEVMLANFDVVIWNVGWAFPTFDEDDRAALAAYLDNGGALFASGQDIGWELHDQGGASYAWYQTYLHAIFINDDTNNYTLDYVHTDPVSHYIDLEIQGGDGANNQDYPSDIDPADGNTHVIWTYDASRNGAIRADDGNHRVVYTAFGWEAVNNAEDRHESMDRIVTWLRTGASAAEEELPAPRLALRSFPTPVRTGANVHFTLPMAGEANLSVYGPDGRVIHELASGNLTAGNHVMSWDATGVPAGIYYYRLDTAGQSVTSKTVVIQ